ncbi:tetratricopeptide repeat protein [Ralstonia pseudosolanacearum]|uniref:tetratricopeptide repeat protein n=1 Tax=Ralstonia pseudosolanacearum TaxID=1310165 RepID=UPI001C753489|nr:tetratricopeptide repeat protein [Ralstonia sp. RS642]QWQ12037.1 tetratricopeptide repeat protein [Ralstonia solanacearum]UZF25018.1 tetratricopeptide repeat protein [Ralstonia sp. RS642]
MQILRKLLAVALLAASLSCWAQATGQPSEREANVDRLLKEGIQLARSGRQAEAVDDFDKAAAIYEDAYHDEKARMYSARSRPEALLYTLEAANAKIAAKVVSGNWAYAYYLKGYVLVEMRRLDEAKAALQRAMALSPHNAQFLTELGGIYQREKDWPMAMQTFRAAEAQAREFSPPERKNTELARAWRGQAYVHVELNQLDEAEALYRKCLKLDANDTRAQNELRFVQGQRAKSAAQ